MGLLDVKPRLDPQMATAMAAAAEVAADTQSRLGLTDVDPFDLVSARALYNADRAFWNRNAPAMADSSDFEIPSPNGPVPVRLHKPKTAASGPMPVLVYLHGGGWIVGNLDTHNRVMRLLADKSGWAVLGVDYHLAPEAKFPVPQQDCIAAADWVLNSGAEYGLDPTRIALGGDSAGANMSMTVILDLASRGLVDHVMAALLYYGSYGLRDSASRRLWGGVEDGLSAADLDFFRKCLMHTPDQMTDPRFNILANPLAGLPPLHIVELTMDPLADDSRALAIAASDAGVTVDHHVIDGVLHGFLHMSLMVDKAMAALDRGAAFLKARG